MKQSRWNRAASGSAGRRHVVYDRLFWGIVTVFAALARGTWHVALGLVLLALGTRHVALAQADLTPRVDTLWTKMTTQTPWVDFQACAMGGNPRGFVVATARREPPQHKFLVEYDINTGQEIRNVRSGHYSDVQHMSFARSANVFSTAEAGVSSRYGAGPRWR